VFIDEERKRSMGSSFNKPQGNKGRADILTTTMILTTRETGLATAIAPRDYSYLLLGNKINEGTTRIALRKSPSSMMGQS
jgi:hypothetical protein